MILLKAADFVNVVVVGWLVWFIEQLHEVHQFDDMWLDIMFKKFHFVKLCLH